MSNYKESSSSEEKEAKRLYSWCWRNVRAQARTDNAAAPETKVFLLLFLQKKKIPSS